MSACALLFGHSIMIGSDSASYLHKLNVYDSYSKDAITPSRKFLRAQTPGHVALVVIRAIL